MRIEEKVYFYRGNIERGAHYEWHRGYSEKGPTGGVIFPWLTQAECRADARTYGLRARFVEKEAVS
jgi:hypothetical protein